MKPSLCLLALPWLLAACHSEAPPPAKSAEAEPLTVKTAPVTTEKWDQTVTILGSLFPKDQATLGAEVEGTVQRTMVEFGDRVTEGQVLAVIDEDTYATTLQRENGNLARAEANLINAHQNLTRAKDLSKTGAMSVNDFDLATAQVAQWEAEVKAAKAGVAMAELNIRRCQIKAPFDGAISERIITKGDYVKTGAPLFTVVNDKVLKFIFEVPERYGSKVEKKLEISFGVDNYPGEVFKGTVYLISPTVSTASRAFNVGALVQNPDLRLKASSFARGTLVLERGQPTLTVPQEAVISYAGVTKVFVAENGKAHSRNVETGRLQDGRREVSGEIKAGDQVILTGLSRLIEGSAVTIETKSSVTAAESSGHETN